MASWSATRSCWPRSDSVPMQRPSPRKIIAPKLQLELEGIYICWDILGISQHSTSQKASAVKPLYTYARQVGAMIIVAPVPQIEAYQGWTEGVSLSLRPQSQRQQHQPPLPQQRQPSTHNHTTGLSAQTDASLRIRIFHWMCIPLKLGIYPKAWP